MANFATYAEVEGYIVQESGVTYKVTHRCKKDINKIASMDRKRLRWSEKGVIEFRGMPYVLLQSESRHCTKEPTCPTTIKIRMVAQFPTYKIDKDTPHKRRVQSALLHSEFSNAVEQEFRWFVKIDTHRCHYEATPPQLEHHAKSQSEGETGNMVEMELDKQEALQQLEDRLQSDHNKQMAILKKEHEHELAEMFKKLQKETELRKKIQNELVALKESLPPIYAPDTLIAEQQKK